MPKTKRTKKKENSGFESYNLRSYKVKIVTTA